jgi:hypothetical protein
VKAQIRSVKQKLLAANAIIGKASQASFYTYQSLLADAMRVLSSHFLVWNVVYQKNALRRKRKVFGDLCHDEVSAHV